MLAPVLAALVTLGATASTVPTVSEAALRAQLAFLADDLLEGRGTGQRGGDLAVRYLASQLEALGLEPVGGKSFVQRVGVRGVRLRAEQSTLRFRGKGGELVPALGTEVVAASGVARPLTEVEAGVVFVGYGIAAPDERWDDYAGVDCRGKLLVMLAGEPPPTRDEPRRFDGPSLTEYGRWIWKFEEAARRGAAGVLLVHSVEGASYGWSVVQTGFLGEKFQLEDDEPRAGVVGWVTEDFGKRLLAAGGRDLDELRRAAQRRGFEAVTLPLTFTGHLESQVRSFTQDNVAALLRGTDPVLSREAVVYSAHWDHFGVADGRIFNGAVDNASGCAALLAMAQALSAHPARRSQLFLFTFGEEQGLLGAKAWVKSGPWPVAQTVADLNLESLNWVGPARDIEFLGGERSSLLDTARGVAAAQGLALKPAEADPAGLYFRSDHFPFARAGVPAISPGFSLAGQRDYLGDGDAQRTRARTNLERYHQPSDDYDPAWDLRGMVQQAQFVLALGVELASASERPRWVKR